ncbi:MAG: hypothetical protein QNJ63_03185 [Calothrix sp. MO_192.B10]|nr:hypothetical protein [Calothrix sp. MO_192.B10]
MTAILRINLHELPALTSLKDWFLHPAQQGVIFDTSFDPVAAC